MPWARLDDRFHENRKIKRLWRKCPTAVGLHVMAITYCAGHLTDGLVDVDFVEDRLPASRMRERAVSMLVEVGLWIPDADGWLINDYLDFNPSRASVRANADRRSEAGRKGAAARWGDSTSHSDRMAGANGTAMRPECDQDAISCPDPTRPVEVVEAKASTPETGRELFAYWQDRCNHPRAKLTRERQAKLKARLSEGYTADDIRHGIDGAALNPPRDRDSGVTYDDLVSICRNGSQLERYMGRADVGADVVPIRPESLRQADAYLAGYDEHGRAITGHAG